MEKYDTFNPTIPDTEEMPHADSIPSDIDSVSPLVEKGKVNKGSRKNAKRQSDSRTKKKSVPFVVKVRNFVSSQTVRWILGLFMGFFAVYLAVAFFSYFSSCVKDQSEINKDRKSVV